jgi:hypothetical protein
MYVESHVLSSLGAYAYVRAGLIDAARKESFGIDSRPMHDPDDHGEKEKLEIFNHINYTP